MLRWKNKNIDSFIEYFYESEENSDTIIPHVFSKYRELCDTSFSTEKELYLYEKLTEELEKTLDVRLDNKNPEFYIKNCLKEIELFCEQPEIPYILKVPIIIISWLYKKNNQHINNHTELCDIYEIDIIGLEQTMLSLMKYHFISAEFVQRYSKHSLIMSLSSVSSLMMPYGCKSVFDRDIDVMEKTSDIFQISVPNGDKIDQVFPRLVSNIRFANLEDVLLFIDLLNPCSTNMEIDITMSSIRRQIMFYDAMYCEVCYRIIGDHKIMQSIILDTIQLYSKYHNLLTLYVLKILYVVVLYQRYHKKNKIPDKLYETLCHLTTKNQTKVCKSYHRFYETTKMIYDTKKVIKNPPYMINLKNIIKKYHIPSIKRDTSYIDKAYRENLQL